MRTAVYARFSSDMQRAASIEDQFRNCRKRVESEGWNIVGTYADPAMRGGDSNRPQYKAMLEAASRGEFDVLIVDDLSRLTRDSLEQEKIIRRLEHHGMRIIATADGYDSNSKARKVHRGVKGLMNEVFLDDLRERTHRGMEGQARKGYWTGGRPYGYRLRPILDPSTLDQYGKPARIGTKLEIDPEQAGTVRYIFERYAEGASLRTIAKELNERGVPTPGATSNRKVRLSSSWINSAVRVILRNPLYGGLVRWNVRTSVRDPDTRVQTRRLRPRSEWLESQDETLRIIPDELMIRAQERQNARTSGGQTLRSGGRPKYLLSGLLKCGCCDHSFVMRNATSYGCNTHFSGGSCTNTKLVRRERIEEAVLGPIREDLLAPERIARMASQIERMFAERMKELTARKTEMPQELIVLDARIQRLRERLKHGDPDMTDDEIQAGLERAEQKRRELATARPEMQAAANIHTVLPRAAALYREQIAQGLDGNPRAALKARLVLRKLFDGKITLTPDPQGRVWAETTLYPAKFFSVGTGYSPVPGDPYAMRAPLGTSARSFSS